MKIEKRQFFYEKIKFFCNEIGRLGLPNKLIKAAKNKKNHNKVFKVFEEFKTNNTELWEEMQEFYNIYSKIREPQIFYGEYTEQGKEKGLFKYDPKEIDPLNLAFLFVLSEQKIEDDDVFENYLDFIVEIENVDVKIGIFLRDSYLDSLEELQHVYN